MNGNEELGDDVQSKLGLHAYLKEDGSLSNGFEIVTHPHTFKAMRELWTDYFYNPVRNLSSYKSGQCGLHVHIGRDGLTAAHIRRMVVFLNAPENLPFVEEVAQRKSNNYSQIKRKTPMNALDCEDRYEALNLRNSETVELRIFRGSYRLDRVLKALDFADSLVEFTRDRSYKELTATLFREFITKNRKRYKWLYGFLTGQPVPTGKNTKTTNSSLEDSQ